MFAASFLAAALAVAGVNAQIVMNSPSGLITCQNSILNWTGTTGQVQISVFPGGTDTGVPLETLPQLNGVSSVTWLVDQLPGSYTFQLKDLSTGQTSSTAPITCIANAQNDVSCVGKNTQGGGASSTPGGDSSTPGGSTPTGSTTKPATSASTTNSGTSPSTPAGSAMSLGASAVLGFVGLAVAAIA
ncbi:hypothetical protein BKA62DRAFT_686809 [Auriculariales sp. MPI-PUGE-AT-0066]|nr:hypothetical protein BKA62DRAFT_686809 [Auriculariales sp. MPI-PUGE-AT-0066]